jgi:hypothetical protein
VSYGRWERLFLGAGKLEKLLPLAFAEPQSRCHALRNLQRWSPSARLDFADGFDRAANRIRQRFPRKRNCPPALFDPLTYC